MMTRGQFREVRIVYPVQFQPYLIEYWFVQRTSGEAAMPEPQTQAPLPKGPPPVIEPSVVQPVSSECVTPKRPPPTLKPWAPKRKRTFRRRVLKYITTSQPLPPWRRQSPIVQTSEPLPPWRRRSPIVQTE